MFSLETTSKIQFVFLKINQMKFMTYLKDFFFQSLGLSLNKKKMNYQNKT